MFKMHLQITSINLKNIYLRAKIILLKEYMITKLSSQNFS